MTKSTSETINWAVYMILADDNSLYTGITTDVHKRFEAHLNKKGAKYFYARKPVKVVYQENHLNRSTATKRELEIKQLSAIEKWQLVIENGYE